MRMAKAVEKLSAFCQAVQETYEQDGIFSTLVGVGRFLPVALHK